GRVRITPENSRTVQGEGSIWWGTTRDREGYLWFGKAGEEIEKYNPLEQRSQYYRPAVADPDSGNWSQYSFLYDKTGRMWISFDVGLYVLEPGADSYQKFTRFNRFESLENRKIYHLEEDEKGIWIASSSGLYLLEPGKGITRRYATEEKPPYRLPHDHLLHFYKDKEGVFWLATKRGGLIRFTPKDGSYQQLTTTDGLSSNTIYAVYEDDYGRLWLPSEYGLMVCDKTNYEIQTYLKGDGIAHNEFNTLSHYRADDGRLYFGGLSGVTVVDPKNFTVDALAPAPAPLRINSCKVLNGKTGVLADKTTAVRRGETIQLSPSDKSLLLNFALLNYENSRKNSYIYTIEGLDKAWTTIEGNNTLRINGLPYGSYVVRIKGQDIRGAVSANELSIPVLVNKPFYLKSWFILSAVFALILLIYGTFRWRLQQLQHAKNKLEQTVTERTWEIRQQKDKIEQQAEKLKELDGVKSRFFANISHELRTPLTLILGPLNSLLGTLKIGKSTDPKEITQSLVVMQRNGKKLLQLIEEILDLSKLEARKMELQESAVAFYTFIKRLFVTFESYAVSRNIRYQLSYDLDSEIQLVLDSDKTEKIITNFLSNAFKYSPDGASISLNVTAKGTYIQIAVHDTGPGIHPNDLPHVFDRFYQSKQANAPVHGGTGIGLALCKELATLMGGEVHVESQWGKGSIFSYTWHREESATLPTGLLEKEEQVSTADVETLAIFPETSETTLIAEENNTQEEKHIVLVVEDHKDMRGFIVAILRDHYQVQTAGDGEKALALLQEKESLPAIILSDVMMPNMDGFTLLKHVKAHPVWRTIPLVLLTARAAQEDRLQALGIGVDDYLTKPFDAAELMARIRNLLINYQERRQWQSKPQVSTTLDIDFGEKPESWGTEWLAQARDIVKKEIANHNYKVSDLAAEMRISESQLLVKMKQITGLTPNEFIREIKLQKARVLLENRAKSTVAEVAYTAGFNTPGYFSTVYEKRFGKRPAAYLADTY
ncbi:MAG: response regulator, partial [Bacteroidota bacterium]